MKLKLPSPEGKVITMRVDLKVVHKFYKDILRSRKGMYTITTQLVRPNIEIKHPSSRERHPEPAGEVQELENGK